MRHGRGQRARCRDLCALPDDHHACDNGCTSTRMPRMQLGSSDWHPCVTRGSPACARGCQALPYLLRGHVYPNAQTAVTRGRCGTCARCGARQRWPARTRCPCATWTLQPGASTCCSAPATTAACASGTCGAPPPRPRRRRAAHWQQRRFWDLRRAPGPVLPT